MWQPGDLLTHRFNPDLGPGRVVEASGRRLTVEFPESGERLQFAAGSDALAPLRLEAGSRARIETSGEEVTVAAVAGDGRVRLDDGRVLDAETLWPLPASSSPVDRLARGKLDSGTDFLDRLDALRLLRLRQAKGLGSFLGGRIRLYPHQLHVAEAACAPAEDGAPVRWLLADEVGLGKTIEACLVMTRLIQTGRAERVLVVAPATLTVQWLGELWRKYHQVFVLLDPKRLRDVERVYGTGFNPFDVYRRAIVSLEMLAERRKLVEQAVAAGIDLLVVDEAHRLKRPPGHPGNAAYRAVAPIAALGKSVLLLSATPLEEDAHGFFRLLQLLRPDELPEREAFRKRLRRRRPLPPCTSATRRADVGGLPPRVPEPVEIDDPKGWAAMLALERRERRRRVRAAGRKRKLERVYRAIASPAALLEILAKDDVKARELAYRARDADPRLAWLAEAATRWQARGEKTLVFVAHRVTLDLVKKAIERRRRARAGIFHEDLSPERRDLEVAQFRLDSGPAILISTEAGGEGRNFEFCRRLVLYDLPWSPTVVEQRIGRLDRIGRERPTEIVYFKPPAGFGRTVAELYERIGLFIEPLGGLERELRHLARTIERAALKRTGKDVFDAALDRARAARDRVQEAAYHELHRDPYRPEMAAEILDRVPRELDALNERVVTRAAERLGLDLEPRRGERAWSIELGAQTLVDHLPGVPAGSRFLGTFDRATAVEDESLDFFATGHPLVEGVLLELEESPRGRTAVLELADAEVPLPALLAIYERPDGFAAVVVDAAGERRPALARRLEAGELRLRPAGPRQAGPRQAGPPQAGPPQAGPPQAGPPQAGPASSGPLRAGPPQAGSSQAGSPQAGSRIRELAAALPADEVPLAAALLVGASKRT